ncbi:hypothetical protein V2S66_31660 [Streptomyces sp. V4-01]|uniref:Uncharacterized protein n=1 Tax=Actinacidiphila polyblastidii TaxID=3110430 RepID=A0ABU7PL04_9ACTN|nr:hypothetical protein [Streptomyces sp. V4-01]
MADSVLAVLLQTAVVAAAVVTAVLAHRTVRHWRGERAGRAYELPVDHRGTALRAGAAGAAALVTATLAASLLDARGAATAPRPAVVAASTATPSRTATPSVPPPPRRTPEPAPPPPEVRTVGHPAGGTLQLLGDGTRVWLPPYYDSARAASVAYPVVVVRVRGDDPDLYAGFASAVRKKKADLFILVMPPGCDRDAPGALAEAGRRYRMLSAQSARGVLGVGPEAPCAVREALTTTGRYGAAAGASGVYPALTAAPGAHPTVMLTMSAGERGTRASALRLKEALRGPRDAARVVDGLTRRREMFARVAAFMTEKLDGPSTSPPAPPR